MGDCWTQMSSASRREGRFMKALAVIILFELFVFVPIMVLGLTLGGQFGYLENVVSLGFLISIFVIIFLAHFTGSEMATQPADLLFVNCVTQYYSASLNTEGFDDFVWMIELSGAVVIEYNWERWLIVPYYDTLYILSPYRGSCTDMHVGRKMREFRGLVARPGAYGRIIRSRGPSVTFDRLLCHIEDTYAQEYGDSISSYRGICYICSSDNTCNISRQIIDSISVKGNVCGVSLGPLYSKKFLGICARTPRSREEFEGLLSFAADIKGMLQCGD